MRDANRAVVSGAYGGFSNVWGAQIMPFSSATFERWPIGWREMVPHYRVALDEMALSGDEDDLSELFPLLVPARPLPPLAERTRQVLDRYDGRRARLQSLGITLGRARLAMRSEDCTRCGLCMTGCPYGLVYSASQTFDRLRAAGRITYRKGVLALRLSERDAVPSVADTGPRLRTHRVPVGRPHLRGVRRHRDDTPGARITRPVRNAARTRGVGAIRDAGALEEPDGRPARGRAFTLNQFNLLYDASGDGVDLCQIHFYPFNPVFETSLPRPLQLPWSRPLATALLRRLSVGLGYLPSWASPKVTATARRAGEARLPELVIERAPGSSWPPMLRQLVASTVRAAPSLDLWPILPATTLSAPAKSYHFGSSFPHREKRAGLGTDRLGRLAPWDRIHLVDGSVFPDVPATTFTLTIMANAHRIATESLGVPE